MPSTLFQDFERDNGLPITVQYVTDRWGPYHVVDVWPRDVAWREWLARAYSSVRWPQRRALTPLGWKLAYALSCPIHWIMDLHAWWLCRLTDAERDRIDVWLAEHRID